MYINIKYDKIINLINEHLSNKNIEDMKLSKIDKEYYTPETKELLIKE